MSSPADVTGSAERAGSNVLSGSDFLQRSSDGLRIAFGIGGLVAIVLGLLMLFVPAASATTAAIIVGVLVGLYAIVTGIIYIGTSMFSRAMGGWARTGYILLGLLFVIAGIIVMSNIIFTGAVVALLIAIMVGVLWLFEGIMALTMLNQTSSKAWTVIYAIVSIIAGIALLFSPVMGAAVLWMLLAISLVVLGIVQAVRAFTSHH